MDLPCSNKNLLKQALTPAQKGHSAAYERLEFLGDRVLGLAIANLLYKFYPNENEGILAVRFTHLVRMETLYEMALKWQLNNLMHTSIKDLKTNKSILADMCEAVLACIFIEKGFDFTQNFIATEWHDLLLMEITEEKDYKTKLQEFLQTHKFPIPSYKIVGKTGPDHNPEFKIELKAKDKIFYAFGASKKQAEQKAAQIALESFNA